MAPFVLTYIIFRVPIVYLFILLVWQSLIVTISKKPVTIRQFLELKILYINIGKIRASYGVTETGYNIS